MPIMREAPEDDPFAELSAEIDQQAPKLENPLEFGSGGAIANHSPTKTTTDATAKLEENTDATEATVEESENNEDSSPEAESPQGEGSEEK